MDVTLSHAHCAACAGTSHLAVVVTLLITAASPVYRAHTTRNATRNEQSAYPFYVISVRSVTTVPITLTHYHC